MRKQTLGGLDIHNITLPSRHETNKVAQRNLLHRIGTVKVIGIVGLLAKPEERTRPARQPSSPGTTDTLLRSSSVCPTPLCHYRIGTRDSHMFDAVGITRRLHKAHLRRDPSMAAAPFRPRFCRGRTSLFRILFSPDTDTHMVHPYFGHTHFNSESRRRT